MRCVICGQGGVDGATDGGGDYVCVDCWASGEAAHQGREAVGFVGASVGYNVHYPADMQRRFVAACNGRPEPLEEAQFQQYLNEIENVVGDKP